MNLDELCCANPRASPSKRGQWVGASWATTRSTPRAINPTAWAWPLASRSRGRTFQDSPLGCRMSTNQ